MVLRKVRRPASGEQSVFAIVAARRLLLRPILLLCRRHWQPNPARPAEKLWEV